MGDLGERQRNLMNSLSDSTLTFISHCIFSMFNENDNNFDLTDFTKFHLVRSHRLRMKTANRLEMDA